METLWPVFDSHEESYEIGGRGAVTDLHLIEKLRFLTSRALDAQLPISIENPIEESILLWRFEIYAFVNTILDINELWSL